MANILHNESLERDPAPKLGGDPHLKGDLSSGSVTLYVFLCISSLLHYPPRPPPIKKTALQLSSTLLTCHRRPPQSRYRPPSLQNRRLSKIVLIYLLLNNSGVCTGFKRQGPRKFLKKKTEKNNEKGKHIPLSNL